MAANTDKNPKDEIERPENFFIDIQEVENIYEKLYCWKFHLSCEYTIKSVLPPIEFVKEASLALEKSQGFPKILEIILCIGNFLNSGTRMADFFAIPLDTIGKLREAKSTNNKSTLLNYFVDLIITKYPKLVNWPDEITHLKAASEVSWDSVETQLGELMAEIDKTLKMAAVKSGARDAFTKIKVYLNDHKKDIDEIAASKNNAYNLWKGIAESYGTEVDKIKPEAFFKIIFGFANDFKSEAKLINDEKEKAEEKMKKATLDNKRQEIEARKKEVIERKRALEIGRKDPKNLPPSATSALPASLKKIGANVDKSKKEAKSEKESASILTNMLGSLVTGVGRSREKGGKKRLKKPIN